MFLIDHRERQIGERHALLHEGVGTHHHIHVPRGEALQDARAVLPHDGGGEQGIRHRGLARVARPRLRVEQRHLWVVGLLDGLREVEIANGAHPLEQAVDRTVVLGREHLGGRHDRGLVTGLDGDEARVQRHEGLAGAHIALEQDVHGLRRGHRVRHLRDRPVLGVGRLERHRGREAIGELGLRPVHDTPLVGLHPMLAEGHAELQREQLVELQAFDGISQRRLVGREVDVAQRTVVRTQVLLGHQVVGERIGHGGEAIQGGEHELADRAGGDPFRGPVHGRDAPRVHEILVGPRIEDLDLLVGQLQPSLVQGGDPRDGHLGPLAVHRGDPGLVEEGEIEVAGAVVQGDGHHGLAPARLPPSHLLDAGDHGHVGADLQPADGCHAGSIDVATRVVMQQLIHRVDREGLGEHLGRGGYLGALASCPASAGCELGVDGLDGAVEAQLHRGSLI